MSDQIDEGKSAAEQIQPANVWDALRSAREARRLSLHQVSAHLKLTVRQLEAIERGDLSVLPGPTFARGFVRNYARYLDLDQAVFLAAIAGPEVRPSPDLPEQMITPSLGRMPGSGGSRFVSALPAGLLVLVLAAVLGAGWHYGWFESREDLALLEEGVATQSEPLGEPMVAASEPEAAASSAQPEVLSSAPALAVSVAQPVSPAPAAAISAPAVVASAPTVAVSAQHAALRQSVVQAAPGAQSAPVARQSAPVAAQSSPVRSAQSVPTISQSAPVRTLVPTTSAPVVPAASAVVGGLPRLVLSFEGESWVTVRDASGKVVFARLNQAGTVQEIQGAPPFDLVIGNATQVRLNWKGRAVDLAPQTKGEVARVNLQ